MNEVKITIPVSSVLALDEKAKEIPKDAYATLVKLDPKTQEVVVHFKATGIRHYRDFPVDWDKYLSVEVKAAKKHAKILADRRQKAVDSQVPQPQSDDQEEKAEETEKPEEDPKKEDPKSPPKKPAPQEGDSKGKEEEL